jgi:hypothetical protein
MSGSTGYNNAIITIPRYENSEKYNSYLGFTGNGMYLASRNNDTNWAWERVITSENYTSYTVKKDGTGATGTWGINVSGSSGSCTGNAATATKSTNIAGGAAGSIPYQSAANTTTFLAAGTAGQTLKMNSNGNAPVWVTDLYEKTISLKVTADWMDTGINAQTKFGDTVLPSGTYVIQVTSGANGQGGLWSEMHSGVMSWSAAATNSSDSDEIFLHKAGHASNGSGLFLRTVRGSRVDSTSGYMKLQIASKSAFSTADNITFKFKKLI